MVVSLSAVFSFVHIFFFIHFVFSSIGFSSMLTWLGNQIKAANTQMLFTTSRFHVFTIEQCVYTVASNIGAIQYFIYVIFLLLVERFDPFKLQMHVCWPNFIRSILRVKFCAYELNMWIGCTNSHFLPAVIHSHIYHKIWQNISVHLSAEAVIFIRFSNMIYHDKCIWTSIQQILTRFHETLTIRCYILFSDKLN